MDSVKNEVEADGIKRLARVLKRWWPAILLVASLALSLVSEIAFQWAKNKGWTTYTPANSGLADDWVTALATDEQGRMWVGVRYHDIVNVFLQGDKTAMFHDIVNSRWMETRYLRLKSGLSRATGSSMA